MTNSKTIDKWFTSKMAINYFQKVLMILSMVGFLYQSITFYQIFMSYQVTVDFTVQDDKDVDFPAITFCADLKFPLSTGLEYVPLESINYSYAKKQSTSLESLLDEFTYKEKKGFVTEYFDSMFGNCFTFNAAWSNRSKVLKILKEGSKTEKEKLSFFVRIPTDEYIFYRAIVIVHSPYVFPNPRDNSIILKPDLKYSYFFTQQTSYLLPPPYHTNCTDYDKIGLSTVRPGLLDQKLCYLECIYNKTYEKCGITEAFTYPLTFEAKEKLGREFNSVLEISDERPPCLKEVDDENIFEKYCNDFCRAPCRKMDYRLIRETSDLTTDSSKSVGFEPSQIRFRRKRFIFGAGAADNNEPENKPKVKKLYFEISPRAADNLILQYSPKFEDIELFGYVGGYLGMWLGFSVLSVGTEVIEFIYSLTKKLKN
ncbi:degenerin-like protein unc-105 [Tachypleus tridentatus]|uniref:degenerin-like protein unc-105 n=1 Tax=Tachypleus tridentatus TaxID=6853 RepID=UPI003FD215CB